MAKSNQDSVWCWRRTFPALFVTRYLPIPVVKLLSFGFRAFGITGVAFASVLIGLAQDTPTAVSTESRLAGGVDENASDEGRVTELVAQREYRAALSILDSIATTDRDVFLLRLKTFCLVELRQYRSALRTADEVLALSPGDTYAAFYRAQALAGLHLEEEALLQVQQVVRSAPESAAGKLVRSEIPSLEAGTALSDGKSLLTNPGAEQATASRLNGRIGAGIGYDSNPDFVPKDSAQSPRDSAYLEGALSVTANVLSERLDESPIGLALIADAYRSHYIDSELDSLDYTIADASLAVSKEFHVKDIVLNATLSPGFRYAWLGSAPFYHSVLFNGRIDAQFTAALQGWISCSYSPNSFNDETAFPDFFDRDGSSNDLSAGLSLWMLDNTLWLQAGYTFNYDDADGSNVEKRSHGAFVTAWLHLPWELQVGAGARFGFPYYQRYVPDPKRSDDMLEVSLSVRRPLFLNGLEAVISGKYLRSQSNQSFADYDRWVGTLSLQYSF
jgi:tetratricopeptide (TPR) repeat protein